MKELKRAAVSLAVVIGFFLSCTQGARAEPLDHGSGTVQVNPVTSYPVVTQGSASFGQSGISASAQASDNEGKKGSGSGYYYGPTYTYKPVPPGQIIFPGPVQIMNGYIVKPEGGVPACPAGQIGYYVYDGSGTSIGIVCVNPPTGGTPAAAASPPVLLAQQVSDTQAWPSLTMSMNPSTGLTGLPSWFWLGGGSPTIPDATATAGPLTVRVHAAFAGVTWAFGDGAQLDTSDLGQPYPQASDVTHEYQADSAGQPNGAYQAVALLRFRVMYSLNSGPWLDLGVKVRGFGSSYVVNQLQPEAVQ